MSVLRFFVRSFPPLSNFGLSGAGFHGDDRGFSHDENVTSRIYAIIQIDLEAGAIKKERLRSDPSVSLFGLITQDYADPDTRPRYTSFGGTIDPYRPDGDQGAQVTFAYTGQNFALPGGNSELEVDRDEGGMGRSLRGLAARIHAIVDAEGRPIDWKLRAGQAHHDGKAIRDLAEERGAWANTPARKNRRERFHLQPASLQIP